MAERIVSVVLTDTGPVVSDNEGNYYQDLGDGAYLVNGCELFLIPEDWHHPDEVVDDTPPTFGFS